MSFKFLDACKLGDLKTIQDLRMEKSESEFNKMISEYEHIGFTCAAEHGHLEIVKFLWCIYPEEIREEMLFPRDYEAFRLACHNGYLEVASFIWNISSESSRKSMLESLNYHAFRYAVYNNHLSVVKFLWENCPPDKRDEMMSSGGCVELHQAHYDKNYDMVEYLISKMDGIKKENTFPTHYFKGFPQKFSEQREQIIANNPSFDLDNFNSQFAKLIQNRTLSKLLLTCKSLSDRLYENFTNMDVFAETANFIIGYKRFDYNIISPIQASQLAIVKKTSFAINSREFYLKVREEKFCLNQIAQSR